MIRIMPYLYGEANAFERLGATSITDDGDILLLVGSNYLRTGVHKRLSIFQRRISESRQSCYPIACFCIVQIGFVNHDRQKTTNIIGDNLPLY